MYYVFVFFSFVCACNDCVVVHNFKLAVLTRYVLRNLKSMLKDGFINVKVAEIAFQKFMNDEGVISLKDAFVESINRIYEEYKLYMDKILDFRKDHPKLRIHL